MHKNGKFKMLDISKTNVIKEATEKMKRIQNNRDTEMAHFIADDLLCEILNEIGCKDLVDEYNKIEKWYA